MSGLFQRIARRRTVESDEATAPIAADEAGAGTSATEPAAPTRYIGAPAPSEPAEASAGATEQLPIGDQPTELFEPLADQPTMAQPMLPEQPAETPAAAPAAQQAAPAAAEPETNGTAPAEPAPAPAERRPGFRERGRMRRRLRYLRRLRELQVRDLGGLTFDLRRFERKRDDLVAQKIDQIRACDDELHALEQALDERRDVRDLRVPGIGGACPRCFSLYGSNDRFCSHCGAALGGLAQGPAQVAAPPPPPPAPPAAPPAGAQHEPTASQ